MCTTGGPLLITLTSSILYYVCDMYCVNEKINSHVLLKYGQFFVFVFVFEQQVNHKQVDCSKYIQCICLTHATEKVCQKAEMALSLKFEKQVNHEQVNC